MTVPETSPDLARPPRRTQAERSEAMRKRLIEATITCLTREGYVGTTVSRIIAEADVSRGAPLHHFSSKAALIEAAAEELIRRMYAKLGVAIRNLADSDDRVTDMIMASWQKLFDGSERAALLELTLASRRDPELADMMLKLGKQSYDMLDRAAWHYFEPIQEGQNPTHLFVLTHWLMQGMVIEQHLMGDDTAFQSHFLRLWAQMLGMRLKGRDGVDHPPPKPIFWRRDA